jgi:prevent-host-death family protein
MRTVSAAEFQKHLGQYQDAALRQPVAITRHGREHLVLLSADEYRRLKSRDRQVLHVTELDESDIHAIADAEVPGEYAHLDAELKS